MYKTVAFSLDSRRINVTLKSKPCYNKATSLILGGLNANS